MRPRRTARLARVAALFVWGAWLFPAAAAAQEAALPPDSASGSADPSRGVVSGRVLSSLDGSAVAGAAVRVWIGEGRFLTAVTDDAGRYRVGDVPAGRWPLRISSLDHASFYAAVQVSPGRRVDLDVELDLRPVVVPALDAIAGRLELLPPGEARSVEGGGDGDAGRGSQADPGLRALDLGTGAAGMSRALDGVRGRTSPDPSSALYARGGASDLKRVMLDGAPVYAPFHLGGLLRALPRGVIGSARLYAGGAPVSYDGGLSYVLDLRTRPGKGGEDGPSAGGHADLLGASVRTDGAAGDLAWNVSARHTQDATSGWLLGGDLPYGYGELVGRFDLRAAPGHRIAVTGFSNRETIDLADAAPEDGRAGWGNRAASLRWGLDLGGTRGLVTLAASRFDTRLPVSETAEAMGRSETDRLRAAVDVASRAGETELTYGLALNRHETDLLLPPSGDETPSGRWQGRATVAAAYGAATVRPLEDVELRGGMRATFAGGSASPHLAPRIAATWDASPSTRLQVATGGFHQVLESPETALSSDLDAWSEALSQRASAGSASALEDLGSASASHVTVRMDHRPGEDLELGLEGYFKTFHGLDGGEDDVRTSGADLWFDLERDGWDVWAGYSLAWAWSELELEAGERRFSGRQLLSAGLRAPLPAGLELTAETRASSGLPFNRIPLVGGGTSPDAAAPPGSSPTESTAEPLLAGTPDGSYLRLDLTLSKRFSGGLLGRQADYRVYLRFLNALDRRDALFYQVDPSSRMRPRALDSLPVLPVVGLEWGVP